MCDNVHDDPAVMEICRRVANTTYPCVVQGDTIKVKMPTYVKVPRQYGMSESVPDSIVPKPLWIFPERETQNEEDTLP